MLRSHVWTFTLSLLAGLALLGISCGPTSVSHAPQPQPLRIVLPASPTPTEQFAASELQRYLEQITGRDWPIAMEGGSLAGPALFVGRTMGADRWRSMTEHPLRTLQTETAALVPDADALYLFGGGDRGTLYAVYAFLEYQGCRWFEPGPEGEVVPLREDLAIPLEPIVQQPVFAVREIGRGAASPAEAESVIDWSVKNRLNRNFNLRMHPAWHVRGGQVLWQHICHNSPWLLPNDPWFETHPELFSLYNGRRIPQAKEGGYLCTTHLEVHRIIAEFITRWFDQHPEGDAVPISPPDGDVKWCECESCMALGGVNFDPGPAGHMTRRQVDLINRVAETVSETHPDRYIVNLAYSRYVWPYEGMRTHPNVINQVAHGYAGNGSLVHSIHSAWNDDARAIFEAWADSGGEGIGIWDYFILHVPDQSGSPMTPLGFGGVATDMIQYLAAFPNPYKVYFTQAGDDLHAYNPFLYYLIARMAWDPSERLERLREDYARLRFGPAALYIARYLTLLDEAYAAADWNPDIWRDITVPSARVFTPAIIEKAWALLRQAEALWPQGHEPLQRMIRSLDYVETTVLPKQLIASDDGVWRLVRGEEAYGFNPGGDADHAERWLYIQERALEKGLLDASMERVLFRTRSREEPVVWLENERMRLGVLPGVGGRPIRWLDREVGGNYFYEAHPMTELVDPGATYFRYGGYEEYTRQAFASPGWEMDMAYEWLEDDAGVGLRMEGVTPESIRIVRTLRMGRGADRSVQIESTLTNEGDAPFDAMIRVHPEFQLTPELDQTMLVWLADDGSARMMPVSGVGGADELEPAGWWGLLDRATGRGFINYYKAGSAAAHVHLDRAYQTLNLELFGNAVTLAPGESTALAHVYEVVNGLDEMPAPLRAVWHTKEAPTEPVDRDVYFVPGQLGQALRLGPTATPAYSGLATHLSQGGAFEAWAKLDDDPATLHDALIMSAGTRQPDYMVLAVREGHLVFYRHQLGDGAARYRAWLKVDAPVPDWPAGEWQHVVVNWRMADDGQGEVALFLNGERLVLRPDQAMVPLREPVRLALGWDSSNASRPRFPGALDQVRLYREPLSDLQIREAYTAGRQGLAHVADGAGVLLTLDFEGHTR